MEQQEGIKSLLKDVASREGKQINDEQINTVISQYNGDYQKLITDIGKRQGVTDDKLDKFQNLVNQKYKLTNWEAYNKQGEEKLAQAGRPNAYKGTPDTNDGLRQAQDFMTSGVKNMAPEDSGDPYDGGRNIEAVKNAPKVVKFPKKEEKDTNFAQDLGYSLGKGVTTVSQGIVRLPSTIYRAAALPQNLLAKIPGLEGLEVSKDKNNAILNFLDDNKVTEYYDQEVEQWSEKVKEYERSATEQWQSGDKLGAIKTIGIQAAESIPLTMLLMASGGSGAVTEAGIGIGAYATGQKLHQLDEEKPDMDEVTKVVNSLFTGAAEAGSESMSMGSIGIGKRLLAKEGTARVKDMAGNAFLRMMQQKLGAIYNIASPAIGEGLTEAASQYAENYIDIVSGKDPDLNPMQGVFDSFLVGSVAGGTISGPIASYNEIVQKPQLRNQAKKDYEKASAELEDLANPDYIQAIKGLSENITDGEQLTQQFLEINKQYRDQIDMNDFLAARNYLSSSIHYNLMNKTRRAKIDKQISNFKDNQGNITTATIEGKKWSIRNVQDLGQENKAIFAVAPDGTVRAFMSHNVKEWETKSSEDIKDEIIAQQDAQDEEMVSQMEPQIVNEQEHEMPNGDKVTIAQFDNGQYRMNLNGEESIFNNAEAMQQWFQENQTQEEDKETEPEAEAEINLDEIDLNEYSPQEFSDILAKKGYTPEEINEELMIERENIEKEIEKLSKDKTTDRNKRIKNKEQLKQKFAQLNEIDAILNKTTSEQETQQNIPENDENNLSDQEKVSQTKMLSAENQDNENLEDQESFQKSQPEEIDGEQKSQELTIPEGLNPDQVTDWVLENSNDPVEIVAAHEQEQSNIPANALQPWEEDMLNRKVRRSDVAEKIGKDIVDEEFSRYWLNGKEGAALDQIAQELSDIHGVNISEQDIIDLMYKYPNGNARKTTEKQKALEDKFKQITGVTFNKRDEYFDKQENKGTSIPQEKLATILNDFWTEEGYDLDNLYKNLFGKERKAFQEKYGISDTQIASLKNMVKSSPDQLQSSWTEENPVPFRTTTPEEVLLSLNEGVDTKIEILDSVDDLPSSIRNHPNFPGRRFSGAYMASNNTAYFIKENIKDAGTAIDLWVHEVGAHAGLIKLLPNKQLRDQFFDHVWNEANKLAKNDPEIAQIINHVKQSYGNNPSILGEEFLAYYAEKYVAQNGVPKAHQSFWESILSKFKEILEKTFNFDSSLTRSDLDHIVKTAILKNYERTTDQPETSRGISQRKGDVSDGSQDGTREQRNEVLREGETKNSQAKFRQGRVLSGIQTTEKAKESLKFKSNTLTGLDNVASDLNIPVNVVHSSETESDKAVSYIPEDDSVQIIADKTRSVVSTKKDFIKEIVANKGVKGLFSGKEQKKFDRLRRDFKDNPSPETDQTYIDRLTHHTRRAFGLTSKQFTQGDMRDVIKEQDEALTKSKEILNFEQITKDGKGSIYTAQSYTGEPTNFAEGISFKSEPSLGDNAEQLNLWEQKDYLPGNDNSIKDETFVERQSQIMEGITFMGEPLTGAPRIKSSQDVAFLFKNLENAATENAFAVLQKPDGEYRVLWLSHGSTVGTVIDPKLIVASAKEYGASKVTFVHNHPSGKLLPSEQDKNVHRRLRLALYDIGIKLDPGVIINLDSGNYSEFTSGELLGEKKRPENSFVGASKVDVYSFDKQVLYQPSSKRTNIGSSKDVAKYLSKSKRGTTPKTGALILNRQNQIVKAMLFDETTTPEQMKSSLLYEIAKHGESVILHSNKDLDIVQLNELQRSLQNIDARLLDVVIGKQGEDILNSYQSYTDQGKIGESEAKYDKQDDIRFRVEETEQFKRWSRNAPILSDYRILGAKPETPQVFEVYHGTTHLFYEFDPSKTGNKEGQFGAVNYFTSEFDDADRNYAGEGPDLTNRIESYADQKEWEIEQEVEEIGFDAVKEKYNLPNNIDEDDYHEIAKHIGRKLLSGGEGRVMELFVRLDNPVVINGDNETWISPYNEEDIEDYMDDATDEIAEENDVSTEEAKEDYFYEIRDRAIELSGVENQVVEAAQRAAWKNGVDEQVVVYALPEEVYYEEISATKLHKALKSNEELSYQQGENGELISHQIIADIFDYLGYDGIVLAHAQQYFANMEMNPNTSHIHLFPNEIGKIKLADGTNIEFDEKNNDIRFRTDNFYSPTVQALPVTDKMVESMPMFKIAPATDSKAFKDWFGDSKVVDENGEPLVVYHGTPNGGFYIFREESLFTKNKKYANRYQNQGASSIRYKPTADNPQTYAVYLSMQNPFDTRNPEHADIFSEYEAYYSPNLTERGLVDWLEGSNLAEWLQENYPEFDGLILDEGGEQTWEDSPYNEQYESIDDNFAWRGLSFMPFSPTQIKSATGNKGTYDPQNPDIRFKVAKRNDDKYKKSFFQPTKEIAYSAALASELFSDLGVRITIPSKSFSSLPVETQRTMMFRMIGAINDSKIRKFIISLIPVDVMNDLIGSEVSPDVLLNNPSMLIKSFAFNGSIPVSVGRFFDSLANSVASLGAEYSFSPSLGINLRRAKIENDSANRTNEVNSIWEAGIVTSDGTEISSLDLRRSSKEILPASVTSDTNLIGVSNGNTFSGTTVPGSNDFSRDKLNFFSTYDAINNRHSINFKGYFGKDTKNLYNKAIENGFDVFIGPNPESDKVYVVDQVDPDTGRFDEHKVILGTNNISEARKLYLAAYEPGWEGLGNITRTDKKGLKNWFSNGNTKEEFAETGIRFKSTDSNEEFRKFNESFKKLLKSGAVAQKIDQLKKEMADKSISDVTYEKIKQEIDTLKEGARLGKKETKEQIKAVQGMLVQYAKKNMPLDAAGRQDVGIILTSIKNAHTPYMLNKAMNRINELSRNITTKSLLSKFDKLLNRKHTKSQSGKPVGTINPDVLEVIEKIKNIRNMSYEQLEDYADELKDDNVEDIALLSIFGSLDERSPEAINDALTKLTQIVEEGKIWYKVEKEQRMSADQNLREQAIETITGGKGIPSGQDLRADQKEPKDSMSKSFLTKNQSLEWLLDWISSDKSEKTGYGWMQKYFGDKLNRSANDSNKGIRETIEMLNEKASKIFGKGKHSLAKILRENAKKVKKTGVTYQRNGERVEIPLSQNEAYKRWMEMQDDTLRPTFEKMGWDDISLSQLEDFITPEVMQWAQWQLYEFYPSYYDGVNEAYKNAYFTNLPHNPLYTPIKREVTTVGDKDDSMLRPTEIISSVANRSLKSRVKNTHHIQLTDGDGVLARHIAEMEHFKAWVETIRELRSVLGSRAVQDAIKKTYGNSLRTAINDRINSLARGGADRADVNHILDRIRSNFVTSALGLNITLFPKQLVSVAAYMNDLTLSEMMGGMLDFMMHPKKAIRIMSQSELIKNRYKKGWTHEIEAALKSSNPNLLSGSRSFMNQLRDVLLIATKLGDRFGIFGGYPVYLKYYKEYKKSHPNATEKEIHDYAMNGFERVVGRSQQSSEIKDTSKMQEGSVGKLFTMFKNSQQQYFRYEMAAIRNLIKGRGNTAHNIKILVNTHIVLPMLFQAVTNLFTDDDEKTENLRLLRAGILGSWNGLLIAGDIIESGLERAMGENWQFSFSPVFDTVDDLLAGTSKLHKYATEGETEDLQKAIDYLMQFTSSTITGIPYEPVKRHYKALTGVTAKENSIKRTNKQLNDLIDDEVDEAKTLKYKYSSIKSKATKLEKEGKLKEAERLRGLVEKSKVYMSESDFSLKDINREIEKLDYLSN